MSPIVGVPASYLAPAIDAREDTKLGWLRETTQEGEAYLKSQRSWQDIDRSIDIISGSGTERIPRNQSRVHLNMIKRDVREAVATLSNMRPLWSYKTDNDDLQKNAIVLNKMHIAWYLSTFADRQIRKALQYASVSKGWISPIWKADFWVAGRGDIFLKKYGPRDVIPYQIDGEHDIQDTYVVTIRNEVPLAKAVALFPTQVDKLSPDRSTPTWMRRGVRRVQRFLSPVLNMFGPGRGKESEEVLFPTVDIFHSYILDMSCNMTGRTIQMGEPGTKWYYEVPTYGSDLPTGQKDKKTGQDLTRKATYEDSRLFPLRRLVMWTGHGILYDNTSTWWHGKVPVVEFSLDDWPWDFLGSSTVAETESVQESCTKLLRAIDDSANARLDPALAYDETLASQALMERLNPRVPGQRIKSNLSMGDLAKPILPAEYYNVPDWIRDHVKNLYEMMHHILGVRDIQAIAKARQVPAGDSIEKLMELAGPLITDMSRNMERGMRNLGEMWKSLAFQFYGLPRRVQVLDEDGITEQDFDYDPGNMVPSHMPDELEAIKQQSKIRSIEGGKYEPPTSRATIIDRAKAHQNSFYFHIVPNSLHQITQLTRKLLYLQLWRSQFPIDPWTVSEALDIPNFGTKPKGHEDSVMGRWIAWKKIQLETAGGQPATRGRKPTGQVAPTLQSKDAGSRTTIRESPR